MPAPNRTRTSESGFSLMEAIVGTVIAVIAIFGLANSFGTGRALVNRYEVARIAAGVAQGRLERLYLEPPGSPLLKLGAHDTLDVVIDGRPVLRETWTVDKYDDPANGHGGGNNDLKRVTVTVLWGQSTDAETVRLECLFSIY